MTNKKILVLVGGGTKHIQPFHKAAEELGVVVHTDNLANLEYFPGRNDLLISGRDISEFDAVYFRLIGRKFEEASLIVQYCREHRIKLVDNVYEKNGLVRLPLAKSLESRMMIQAGIPFPKTYFGRLKNIKKKAPEIFGYPFVMKRTTGRQGHGIHYIRDESVLEEKIESLILKEKKGERYVVQEIIKASQRNRIFVVGDKAIAGITRPTGSRKLWQERDEGGNLPNAQRSNLDPIPQEDADLAVRAAKAVGVDVGGADILTEDETGKKYILEVNSAPGWKSIKKDTGVFVEREILEYILSLL